MNTIQAIADGMHEVFVKHGLDQFENGTDWTVMIRSCRRKWFRYFDTDTADDLMTEAFVLMFIQRGDLLFSRFDREWEKDETKRKAPFIPFIHRIFGRACREVMSRHIRCWDRQHRLVDMPSGSDFLVEEVMDLLALRNRQDENESGIADLDAGVVARDVYNDLVAHMKKRDGGWQTKVRLLNMLLRGMTCAEVARVWGVTANRVTNCVKEIRTYLYLVVRRKYPDMVLMVERAQKRQSAKFSTLRESNAAKREALGLA